MKNVFVVFFSFIPFFLIAQCTVEDYKILLQEAKVAQKLGKYDLAFNKLLSAQICQSNNPEKVIEVKNRILEVFQEVNIQRTLAIQSAIEAKRQKMIAESQRDTSQIERNNAIRFAEEARRQRDSANIERNNAIAQRKIAEENAREFYANDLAYKSQAALENGNLSVAFRLADFAKRFIHQDNPNINRALTEALYFNDHPEDIHRLPWHYILSENYSEVTCVAYSPDGKWLASGFSDNAIYIYNLESRKLEFKFKGLGYGFGMHDYPTGAMSIDFSPDGKKIAVSFYNNNNARIWDLNSKKCSLILKGGDILKGGHTKGITEIKYSSDGKKILTVSEDHSAVIWDSTSGEILLEIGSDKYWVSCAAFSTDSRLIATGNIFDGKVKIREASSGKTILTLKGHSSWVNSISFLPNGQQIATGASDGTIKIWNLSNGKSKFTLNAGGGLADRKGVNQVSCFSNGQYLASISHDHKVKIWDLSTQKNVLNLNSDGLNEGHFSNGFAINPNASQVATSGKDKTIKIWDISTLNNLNTLEGHEQNVIRSLAFSPDGTKLITGGSHDYTAKIWDLATGKPINTIKHHDFFEGHQDVIWCVAFSPDGERFATVTSAPKNNAKIWDVKTGKQIISLIGHSSPLTSVTFAPNGELLATGGFSDVINLWNLSTGKIYRSFKGHKGVVSSVVFSPEGKHLATGSWDSTIIIWDLFSGEIKFNIKAHSDRVQKINFSKSGNLFATCSSDSTAKIWSTQTGKLIQTLEGHQDWVLSLAFSPDDKLLATSSSDGTVKIWNIESGRIEHSLPCHIKWVWDCAFSPDGSQLATVAWNNTIHLWPIGQPKTQISHLNTEQLRSFGLDKLLDQLPENENRMIQSNDALQIAAFAVLYYQKIIQNENPEKIDYERAKRLLTACISDEVNKAYFEKKLADLEWQWKEKTK